MCAAINALLLFIYTLHMFSYNIHTNSIDLGANVTVSEIDGLETITTASGTLSLSGADVVDVNNLSVVTVTAQNLISASAEITTAKIDTLRSIIANIGTATIDALTSTTARIQDLFTTNLNLVTLTVRELFASVVSIDGKLDVYGTVSNFGDTYMNRDATVTRDMIVGGTFSASNIIKFAGNITFTDTTGEYVWRHATLKPPIVHLGNMVAEAGGRAILTTLEFSEADYATFRFYQLSFIGPVAIGGTIKVCFIAIGS
jgi:hypothetical protein